MNVLFLCTGNYYRSRFAEEYFNALAEREGLPSRAASRGLAEELNSIGNSGPVSKAAVSELEKAGISLRPPVRYPLKLLPGESRSYDRIICLDRDEHLPMVQRRNDLSEKKIIFWDIKDLDEEPPETAMARCREKIEKLIDQLRRARKRHRAIKNSSSERRLFYR